MAKTPYNPLGGGTTPASRGGVESVCNLAKGLVEVARFVPLHPAVGLSSGAVGGLAAHFFGAPSLLWFIYGFFLAVGPMYWFFTSSQVVRQHLATIRLWKEDGLITQAQYRDLRASSLEWLRLRRF